MILGCVSVSARSVAQNQRVSLNLRNCTVMQLFEEIQQQTRLFFFYDQKHFQGQNVLTVRADDEEVGGLLKRLFADKNVEFVFEDQTVIVRPAVSRKQVNGKVVKGVVRDAAGHVLPGVTVVLKGTTLGTSTDIDGKYTLTLPEGEHVLVFSMIGMKMQEFPLGTRTELDVTLQEEVAEMEEVVVTGIFKKAKESYTGAVSSIDKEQLKIYKGQNLLQTLKNIDVSINLAVDNINGSNPNRMPQVNIRGNSSLPMSVQEYNESLSNEVNTPLIILDGFEIALERLMDYNDEEIESINILKDAAATAIYGSRGSNGVIVVTTKQPEAGKLRVNAEIGIDIEAPDLTSYDLLNAAEKLQLEWDLGLYKNESLPSNDVWYKEAYAKRKRAIASGTDTDWLSKPLHTGVGSHYNLRMEGGSDEFRWSASVGYKNTQGAMRDSERKSLNTSLTLMYKVKNFTFKNQASYGTTKSKESKYGTFSDYGRLNAYWKPYDEEGNLIKSFEYMPGYNKEKIENPLHNASLPGLNKKKYTEIRNNFAVDLYMLPELFVRGRFGINGKTTRSDKYLSKDHTSFEDYTGDDYDRRGSYTYGTGENFNYEADLTLNYSKTFHEIHQLYVGLGYNVAQNKSESYTIKAEGFSDLNMDFLTMAGQYAKNSKPGGSESSSRRIGGIANVNYTFNRKYFVDASGKFDGSSQFGANKRFAPFWSVGMGWNIHQEDFAKESKWLNTARIRLSYGTSGSQSFSSYQAKTTYKYFGSNYSSWNGAYVMALGNDELGWQVTRQWNLGIDMDLFNGRLRINADVYNKITDNLLSDITLPSASGFPNYKANVGKVVNRGVELTLNAYIIRDSERDLMWSVGGSLAHNKNEIKEISNSLKFLNEKLQEEAGSNPSFLFEEGQSMNTIFVVPSRGIDPSTGKELFVKKDGSLTTVWDAKDKVPCGVSEPKVWGNLNTMFRWKGVSLNAVFGYRLGGQMYNSTLISKVENIEPYENADKRVLYDRWKNPGDRVFFKSVKDQTETKASSRFVMDERTLECRSVSLSYDWDAAWLKNNLGVSYLTVSGYMEDVFRISSVKQERGLNYPFARKFSVSLTARF